MPRIWIGCCLASMLMLGCGESRLPVVNATGKVYVDDKPYGPAMLSLSPLDRPEKPKKGELQIPNCSATVSADGSATFSSYTGTKGIVPGKYQVHLNPDPMAMNQ